VQTAPPQKEMSFPIQTSLYLKQWGRSLPWEVVTTPQRSLTSQRAPKQTEANVLIMAMQP